MGRKMFSCFTMVALLCVSLLLLSACAKKTIPVSTPTADTMGEQMSSPDSEMSDAEAIRQQRLKDLEGSAQESAGVMNEKILFDFDSSELTLEARATLKEIADMMSSYPSWSLDISGHCDERGTIEYNLALGERRAISAKKYLVKLGIAADRIATISYGEERPIDPGHSEEAWAKNRRCEFSFIK